MSDERVNEDKFFVPFAKLILLVLHTEETTYIDVVFVDDFTKPFGIHNNDLLTCLIEDFLFFDIFKRRSLNGSELAAWDDDCFHFYVSFDGNIGSDKSSNKS